MDSMDIQASAYAVTSYQELKDFQTKALWSENSKNQITRPKQDRCESVFHLSQGDISSCVSEQ